MDMLPGDSKERWSQSPAGSMDGLAPKRFTVGVWNFGNMAGVMKNSFLYPWVTLALTALVSTWNESLSFTSCVLSRNMAADLHRDSRNLRGSLHLALPCSQFQGVILHQLRLPDMRIRNGDTLSIAPMLLARWHHLRWVQPCTLHQLHQTQAEGPDMNRYHMSRCRQRVLAE